MYEEWQNFEIVGFYNYAGWVPSFLDISHIFSHIFSDIAIDRKQRNFPHLLKLLLKGFGKNKF